MALNLTQKQDVVAEVAEIAAKAHSLIAAEYAGTTVSQMTAMRKKARENGVYLKVVKNTLAARAVAGTEYEVVQDKLVGPLNAWSQPRPMYSEGRPSPRAGQPPAEPIPVPPRRPRRRSW